MGRAMSVSRDLSIYNGRMLVGIVTVVGDTYLARLADPRELGPFANLREAAVAIYSATGRPASSGTQPQHSGAAR